MIKIGTSIIIYTIHHIYYMIYIYIYYKIMNIIIIITRCLHDEPSFFKSFFNRKEVVTATSLDDIYICFPLPPPVVSGHDLYSSVYILFL